MTVSVLEPGLQTTLQSWPRRGQRHLGVPDSGPADPLSMALANRLVGNGLLAPALEITLTGPTLRFDESVTIAITGGDADATLDGDAAPSHTTLRAEPGAELDVGPVKKGARVYVAVAGGFVADEMLGSSSTYLPAALGGFRGRALLQGDELRLEAPHLSDESIETPEEFRPPMTNLWAIRATQSVETSLLDGGLRGTLAETNWTVGRRADRMGMRLEGARLRIDSDGRLPSAPVFPGTVQCPEDGAPYVLGIDSGTTGGYPRIAQVARVDRHLLGQVRPGDRLSFLPRRQDEAIGELRAKHDYWREWLPGIEAVI